MALIDGKLDGVIVDGGSYLEDTQTIFPFESHMQTGVPLLIISQAPGQIYEVSLSDGMFVLYDILSAVKLTVLKETLTDIMSNISDSVDPYKYVGYIFLKDGVKFEIKGHDQWRK